MFHVTLREITVRTSRHLAAVFIEKQRRRRRPDNDEALIQCNYDIKDSALYALKG